MYKEINKSMFMDEFNKFDGRYDQMGGYYGLSGLYDYLIELEEETGEPMELDVIALCCDFTQYDTIEDAIAEYDNIKDLEDLKEHTTVIEYEGNQLTGDSGGLIIQDF